jgi:ferritin-like metal-binding protein YciE
VAQLEAFKSNQPEKGLFKMHVNNLEGLMIEELKDLYDAENQNVGALNKMAKEASSTDLRRAFEDHLKQTKTHVKRLDEVFRDLEVSDRKKECKGMQAIIQEGEEMLSHTSNRITGDASLIAAAQHAEHYEMAGYGTVISFAHQLNLNNVADKLQQTLNEEKQTDLKLSQIAESKINVKAAV